MDASLTMKVACAYKILPPDSDDYCNGSYPTISRLKEHLKTRHDFILIAQCSKCHLCFRTNREREDHKKPNRCIPAASSSTESDLVLQWRGIVRYIFPETANSCLPSPYAPSFQNARDACAVPPEAIRPALIAVVNSLIDRVGLSRVPGIARILTDTGLEFTAALLQGLADLDAETVVPTSAAAMAQGGGNGRRGDRASGQDGGDGGMQQHHQPGETYDTFQQPQVPGTGGYGYSGAYGGIQMTSSQPQQQQYQQQTSTYPISSTMGDVPFSPELTYNATSHHQVSTWNAPSMPQYTSQGLTGTGDMGMGETDSYAGFTAPAAGYPGGSGGGHGGGQSRSHHTHRNSSHTHRDDRARDDRPRDDRTRRHGGR